MGTNWLRELEQLKDEEEETERQSLQASILQPQLAQPNLVKSERVTSGTGMPNNEPADAPSIMEEFQATSDFARGAAEQDL